MMSDGHTCKTWPMTEDYCYDKPADWRYYQYCSQYCSEIGMPYKGASCCEPEIACNMDVRECSDGSFVPRDPANGCQFPSCPNDGINRVDSDDNNVDPDDEYPQLAFGEDSDELLADCRGDCDSTEDCESGLVCYQRSGFDVMPGCSGNPSWDTDYCLDTSRNFKELAFLGQKGPFGRCAGDCDSDKDCFGDRICFQRDGEVNNVPGCPGRAVDNVDYCIDRPTPAPTPAPTQTPTDTPLNRGDDSDCIQCQDKPTPYMQSRGISCKDWSMTQYRCSEQSSYYSFWQAERFCELSCAVGGSPYPGPRCCGVEDVEEDERGTGDTGGSRKRRNNGRRHLGKKSNPYDV